MSRDCPLDCKVYVGDLPTHVNERDLEPTFSRYGPLVKVWVARNPPGFAFIQYEDPLDAEDAIKELDGREICGARVRVEACTGKSRAKPWDRRPRRGGNDIDEACYSCGERGHYARDCRNNSRRGGRQRSRSRSNDRRRRSRSRSRRRSYSRSPRRSSRDERRKRSRSLSKGRDSRSRNGHRSSSRSPKRSTRNNSPSPRRSRSKSRSRSPTPKDY